MARDEPARRECRRDEYRCRALFDKVIQKGQSFEHTFTAAGEQPYFCRFHEGSGMTGTVTVLP